MQEGIIVRAHSPFGFYPRTAFHSNDNLYLPSTDLVITVCRFGHDHVDPDAYSEMEWAKPEEIRLWASMTLAFSLKFGRIHLYPFFGATSVAEQSQALTDLTTQTELINLCIKDLAKQNIKFFGSSPPPRFGGCPYELRDEEPDLDIQTKLLASIDLQDHVLMRGLATLIRSGMLASHYQFLEEAATTLFISLEATFRLVLRRLREQGLANPTSNDAGKFINQVFNGHDSIERYFSEYYDKRVATYHPESRFGIATFAPLQADDYYDLYADLLDLYCFLIIGARNDSAVY